MDAAAQAVYEQMRELGQTFTDTSADARIRARLTELGLLNPDTDAATEAAVALIRALSAAHEKLDAARHQQAVAMTLARHFLHAANGRTGEVSVEFYPRSDLARLTQTIDELVEMTCHEIVTMHPYADWSEEPLAKGRRRAAETKTRGIRTRSLFHQRYLNDRTFREHTSKLVQLGYEVRFVPFVPTWMLAFDGRTVVLQVDRDDIASGTVVISGTGVVTSLIALFEYCWISASEAAEVPYGAGELTDQQRMVVRLLASGAKDDAIARTLSLSTRTVARIVSELLSKLNAASRFQAGVRASKLGWLD
ncbi:LuxR C-terminal-related transcriptional regulator [Nonomuraea sp. NPDC059194]|uniref:helix-turn-helix transcriptional regulator n=1 Tax=Nonomuraea sp. NPDC059194 TaxID=3346764 RepID=UPI0036A4DBD1